MFPSTPIFPSPWVFCKTYAEEGTQSPAELSYARCFQVERRC